MTEADVDFEIKRQLVHGFGGILIASAAYTLIPKIGALTAIPLFVGVLLFSMLPQISRMLHLHNELMTKFERSGDVEHTPYKGAINYGLGILPAVILLNAPQAAAVIMILSVGDAASTIVGVSVGRTKVTFQDSLGLYRKIVYREFDSRLLNYLSRKVGRTSSSHKTLEGFMGFMLGAFAGAVFFVGIIESIFLAIAGGFIELLVPLDDNISIPWILTILLLAFVH